MYSGRGAKDANYWFVVMCACVCVSVRVNESELCWIDSMRCGGEGVRGARMKGFLCVV